MLCKTIVYDVKELNNILIFPVRVSLCLCEHVRVHVCFCPSGACVVVFQGAQER